MFSVSIIAPLYNKASYVAETIRSVLAQTRADWEMLVVDNGSTDGGADIARAFDDARLRVVVSPRQGPGAARNYGVGLAQGEWIQFLDADDWLAPDQLEQQLATAAQHPDAMIIAGGWREMRDKQPGRVVVQRPVGRDEGLDGLRDAAFAFPPWAVHAALVKRAALTPDYLWPEELDRFSNEDAVFWFRLVMTHRVAFSPATGAFYRMQTPTARNQLDDPAKRLQEFDLAAEYNQRWLTEQRQAPTPGQAAALMQAYSSVYEAACRANDLTTAEAAMARAEQWLKRYFALARRPTWPMRLRRWLGLPRFLRYRRLWTA
ncbi:MAG: glycosyl transferase [Chloracidobacterium sp. CP2_5A]|nr:MAG: glycosyl transferase [Chloracidobacterium sp. CP2_5A]